MVPKEAKIIKRIYEQYLVGYGTNKICRNLERDGIKTPTGSAVCSLEREDGGLNLSIINTFRYAKKEMIMAQKLSVCQQFMKKN
ncbi:recombinase family protein [Clostridium cochlearium]|uniref:recombinase family protein n=1 Tax=Clostridium cochlearium TaxID=1494 RepID=UPI003F500963